MFNSSIEISNIFKLVFHSFCFIAVFENDVTDVSVEYYYFPTMIYVSLQYLFNPSLKSMKLCADSPNKH